MDRSLFLNQFSGLKSRRYKSITYWENIHNQVARLEIDSYYGGQEDDHDVTHNTFEPYLYIYDNLGWNCKLDIVLSSDIDDKEIAPKYILECMDKMYWYPIDIAQVENKGFEHVIVR